jgi:hypothetical protein
MNKTGLWPREKPRPTDSHAELNVYEALRHQLPNSWIGWHALRPASLFPDLPPVHVTPQHNRHEVRSVKPARAACREVVLGVFEGVRMVG